MAASPGELGGVRLDAPRIVAELASEYGGALDAGLADAVVLRIVPPELAKHADDLVVVTSTGGASRASSNEGIVLCQSDFAERVPTGRRWVHPHAMWVVARLLLPLVEREAPTGVDRSAWVHPAAFVAPTAVICPRAVVLAGAQIGEGTVIGEGAVIYPRTRLGVRVTVGPLAVVGRPGFGWTTGPGGETLRVPQLGGVVVEDDVEIGPLCTVDAGTLSPTILRRGVRLDAQVHVAHNVEIGEGTLVAAQSGFAGSARIGAAVLVGGQVGVADHAEIGARARIAGKSGVIGNIAPGAIVAGYPAISRARWLRVWARLLGDRKKVPR